MLNFYLVGNSFLTSLALYGGFEAFYYYMGSVINNDNENPYETPAKIIAMFLLIYYVVLNSHLLAGMFDCICVIAAIVCIVIMCGMNSQSYRRLLSEKESLSTGEKIVEQPEKKKKRKNRRKNKKAKQEQPTQTITQTITIEQEQPTQTITQEQPAQSPEQQTNISNE